MTTLVEFIFSNTLVDDATIAEVELTKPYSELETDDVMFKTSDGEGLALGTLRVEYTT